MKSNLFRHLKRSAAMFALFVAGLGAVHAGIFNTKHNLGSTGINAASNFSGTSEICVFCHTPHGGDSSAAVPLWNRHLDPAGFLTYDQLGSTTLDGQIEPVGSVSVACLSCHDGTQAMDSMINAFPNYAINYPPNQTNN